MERITPLCEIAYKYGTDKCPQLNHHYTPVYYDLFKDKRESTKKLIEIGIGSRSTMRRVPEHYQTGAGLLMWQEFFPNAQIYGVDIQPDTLISDKRIQTFLYNTKSKKNLEKLIAKTGSDIDILIDDGTHVRKNQINTFHMLMPMLKKEVIYIIEDVKRPDEIVDEFKDYDYKIVKLIDIPHRHDNLIIIKNR